MNTIRNNNNFVNSCGASKSQWTHERKKCNFFLKYVSLCIFFEQREIYNRFYHKNKIYHCFLIWSRSEKLQIISKSFMQMVIARDEFIPETMPITIIITSKSWFYQYFSSVCIVYKNNKNNKKGFVKGKIFFFLCVDQIVDLSFILF